MYFLFPILRILVSAVLFYSGIAKLLTLSKTRTSLEEFGVPERFSKAVAAGIPIAELLIAIAILLPATAKAGLVAAYILFGVFTGGVVYNLLIGRTPACGCFGQRSQTPISIQTVLRNFALMAVTAIALSGLQTAYLLIIIVVLGVPLAAVLVLMIALLRRILERTEQLEERLEEIAGAIQIKDLKMPGDPLPIGSPAPLFELEAMDGGLRRLEDVLENGTPAILLFMSPDCGPCLAMLPHAEGWMRDFNGRMGMIVISKGSLEKNLKEFGSTQLEVLIQQDSEVGTSYRAKWTPAAIAISGQGAILSSVAFGESRGQIAN